MREIADLDGPRGLPLVGNAPWLEPGRAHRTVEAWNRRYGPSFRFRVGRACLVAISDHEAVSAALRDRPDGFRRSRLLEIVGQEIGLAPGLFASNGEAWRQQRRMVMAGLDPTHVKDYYPALARVVQRLRGRWERAAAGGQAIDLQPELMRYTVDAISGLAFGTDVNTLESDDEVIQQHLDKIFPAIARRLFAVVPWWRWFPGAADRALVRSVAAVDTAIAGFIAAARERLAADPQRAAAPSNLLEAMIVAADAGIPGVTDREVAGNVLTMLLAGEDTTANSLAWLLYLLHRQPEAMRRATEEVRALGLDSRDFELGHLASLDYLEACAHETMRLKPVAPVQIIEAVRETEIAGIRIPPGTRIWCVMRADAVDAKYFPEPEVFRPERWLGDAGPAAAASSAKRVSMPFGAGPRICPGRYLALLEMKMALAMLLNHFDIEAVSTPDGAEAVEALAFTMAPVGLRMRLRLRKPG